jgi:tRNA-Thr(GGU) m(6)t(6)A37 methyltransferase TsaA
VSFELEPVAVVRSSRHELIDDRWDGETSFIELLPHIDQIALTGLDSFSHCLVVGYFDRATAGQLVRHPRGNPSWPLVGIFAQRAKDRPNRLAVSVCAIDRIDDNRLHVRGLDFVNGTPILDIKPWMAEFGPRGDILQPTWSHELMATYWDDSSTD